jgi:OOP family OmpA-OmpF porin
MISIAVFVAMMVVSAAGLAQIQLSGVADLGKEAFSADDVVHVLGAIKRRSVVPPRKEEASARAAVADPGRRLSLRLTPGLNPEELSPSARQRLDVVAAALQSKELATTRFVISGHTDTLGDHDNNVKTSQRWADAVRAYLVNTRHLDPQRLEAVGVGPDQPLDPAYPESPTNRRVQIVALD